MEHHLRAARAGDLEPIKAIAVATELFTADDVSLFDEEAHIRQFYGPDDDKVVYWKSLTSDE